MPVLTKTIVEIEAEIDRYRQNFGAVEHTGTALRGFIGESLSLFAERAMCWYADRATYTTTSGEWDLDSVDFTVGASTFKAVRIRDIRTATGLLVKIDEAEGVRRYQLPREVQDGGQAYWMQTTDRAIELVPGPTVSTTYECSLWHYPTVVTSASNDATSVVFPHDAFQGFILFTTARLMVTTSGAEAAKKQAEYEQRAELAIASLKGKYARHPEWLGCVGEPGVVSLGWK